MFYNKNTDNLIILTYNPGAGGKFLLGCLALANDILHLEKIFAETKFKKGWTEQQSFRASMSFLRLSEKHNTHIEFDHGYQIYGFTCQDNQEVQENKSNDFFKQLSNQSNYKFVIPSHYTHHENLLHFQNAKNIVMVNDETIVNARTKIGNLYENDITKSLKNIQSPFQFDVTTFNDETLYAKELQRLCDWLGVKINDYKLIEIMRQKFIKNLSVPIPTIKDKATWGGRGYFRGSITGLS